MSHPDRSPADGELTEEEVERQEGEPLPDREAMSIITPGYELPVPVDELPDPLPPHNEAPDDRYEQ